MIIVYEAAQEENKRDFLIDLVGGDFSLIRSARKTMVFSTVTVILLLLTPSMLMNLGD